MKINDDNLEVNFLLLFKAAKGSCVFGSLLMIEVGKIKWECKVCACVFERARDRVRGLME